MHPETIQPETLRQKIEDLMYESGDRANYLDYGKPKAAEAKKTQETIKQLDNQAKALQAELKLLIADMRAQHPQAFEEWINYHTGMLQKIMDENTKDPNERTRKFVAKQTLEEWEKVRAGEQDYVNINWNFLKDYKAEVRTITGGTKMNINTGPSAGDAKKSRSWWPFGK
jgi:hypothetical protein